MDSAHPFKRPDTLHVTFRRMRFPFENGFDKYWHGGSPFRSFFWDALSSAFRPGETFFIDSARALKDRVTDDKLQAELLEFCKQEGHHTAQHVKFNKMVEAQGLPMTRAEGRFAWALNRGRSKLTPEEQLAATCALEHFTAGFAHQYLTNPALSEGADPGVDALWKWHAVEELEHKATCHDVYQAADGRYFRRVGIMIGSWFMIMIITFMNLFLLLRKDGKLFNFRDNFMGLLYLFGRRGLLTRMIPWYLAYFRPTFHPWDYDNSRLVDEWAVGNSKYVVQSAKAVRDEAGDAAAPA